ncbi:MAG TPA: hypothetical protein VF576_09010, partial [Rubricoccaceae bacterium]
MRLPILLALVALAPALTSAQTPGSCALGTAQADLATPDLSARLFNTGALFYGNTTTSGDGYFVPRSTRRSPIFASALWIGGMVDGQVRTASGTYGTVSLPYNFWPGPLDPGATLPNPADCSAYDRIYVVAPADVAAYEAGGAPSADLAGWPVGLGAQAVTAGGEPVPVTSRGQTVDLAGGERPVLYGGPTAFWVMNDVGNVHGEGGSAPLGVEVRVTAFAVSAGPVSFRQSTFYRYTVVNRNTQPIEGLHVGFFADPDLGDAVDDYVGVDTTRGMAFAYNADNADPVYGVPPALGFDLLTGLWASSWGGGSAPATEEPFTATEFYARLRGLWGDETTIRAFGDGYQQTQGAITRFTYPGDPVTGTFWSAQNTGAGTAAPGDYRFITSAPPVALAPGASHTVDLGVLFAQGISHLQSVTALRSLSDVAQSAYDGGVLFGGPASPALAAPSPLAPAEGASFYEAAVTFSWTAVPGADFYSVEVSLTADFTQAEIATVDGSTTSVTLPAAFFRANRTAPFYWRVRAIAGGTEGLASATQTVTVYRYEPAPLTLVSGALAFVEVTAPGGGPSCDGPLDPDEGCDEVGGDLVYESLNSTGDYLGVFLPGSGGETASGTFAPHDFELRFTAEGSYAYDSNASASRHLFRVPFEVWDVGVVTPGTANNPSDDRQLIAQIGPYRTPEPGPDCAFQFDNPTLLDVGLSTRRLSAYFPVGTYAFFETAAAAAVASDPAGCPVGAATQAAVARVNTARGMPVRQFILEQAGTRTTAELTGTTIRFYTAERLVGAEDGPAPGPLALGAPFPNPTGGRVTLPYTVAAAGPVRLRVVDVLGRTVAVVADGARGVGAHEGRLDT